MKIQKGRLLRLAAFLDNLPPERFNFSHSVGDDWQGKPDLSCGTTACGIGWASTMPEFRKLGLRLRAGDCAPVLVDKWRHVRKGAKVEVEIFGLTEMEFMHLFSPYFSYAGRKGLPGDASPKDLADHIRSFVTEV